MIEHAFDNLSFSKSTVANGKQILKLLNNGEPVAKLNLYLGKHNLWQISKFWVKAGYENIGCFRYLVTSAALEHNIILSNCLNKFMREHSWTNLITVPGWFVSFLQYDTNSQTFINLSIEKYHLIKNNINLIIAIKNNHYIINPVREKLMEKIKKEDGIDRTEKTSLYGRGTSVNGYFNP